MTFAQFKPWQRMAAWGIAGVAAVVALIQCAIPEPTAPAPPRHRPEVKTTSTATATASGSVSIKVRDYLPRPTAQEPREGPRKRAQVSEEPPYREIEIKVDHQATAQAGASASLPPVFEDRIDHGALGVLVGMVPGVVAVDLQVARVEVPPWVFGMSLEAGGDLEANLEQVGVGLSLGGKVAATGGVYTRWNLSEQGMYAGVVVRF